MEVTVAEMGNEQESFLTGGDFVSEGNIYRAKSTDTAPEVALAYATKMIDSGYRLFRHPVCKVMSIKVEHKTAGDGTEVAAYVLTLRNTARKIDGLYREQKDVETEDFSWIETVEQLPIPAGP